MSEVHFTLVALIDILGLVQATLLGLILIVGSRGHRANWLLGIFLITYGLEIYEAIVFETGLAEQAPEWLFLPFNFYYLTLPVFYLYTKSLLHPISLKKEWKHLFPGIIELLFFSVLFLFPAQTKLELITDPSFFQFYDLLEYGSLFFSIWYAYKVIKLVNRHQQEVLNYYSSTNGKLLKWVKGVAWAIIAFYMLWVAFVFLPEKFSTTIGNPVMGALNVLFIFWVALSGFKQSLVYVPEFIAEKKNPIFDKKETLEYTTESSGFEKIKSFLEKEKVYTNPQLLLSDLAEQLSMPQRTLSELINSQAGMNFNQFINHYRVEEAKRLIIDPKFSHLNLLGIGYEVGFNSKTSFYTTFKNVVGMTPSKFQKEGGKKS